MSNDTKLLSLIKQVYCPPISDSKSFSVHQFLGLDTNALRYFSLGRHALAAALRVLEVGKGDIVAMPEFICRDLFASVASVGASIALYPVNGRLALDGKSENLLQAKAVIAVNFFGFPQDLSPFKDVTAQTGATIIEDNAHGFLSRDGHGVALGMRAFLGVFSLRKTFPIINGGALAVNDAALAAQLPESLSPNAEPEPAGYVYKQFLRKTVPFIGTGACRMSTGLTRLIRKIHTGHSIPPPGPDSEVAIPLAPEPHAGMMERLSLVDVAAEIERRRNLYLFLESQICDCGGAPVFEGLQPGVCPYVMPFRASNESISKIARRLRQLHLECHRWPDLPKAAIDSHQSHYVNIWMVPFLW